MSEASYVEEGIRLSGSLTLQTVANLEKTCHLLICNHPNTHVAADVSTVVEIDTAGVIFLHRLRQKAQESGKDLTIGPLPENLQSLYDFIPSSETKPQRSNPTLSWQKSLGDKAEDLVDRAGTFLFLASDLTWASIASLWQQKDIRRSSFVDHAIAIGSQGLPIVALILLLIGGVSTLQAAAQLRQFGANIFVADLLAIGITRELGPLMTAIIVAGRSGSAIAAEVATMKFSEEIDALKTMALDPLRFVAVPKMWAMLISVPLLTIVADFVGLAGGTCTGVLSLDITPSTFVTRVSDALVLKDILTGLVKSVSFAWAITVVAVYQGLQTSGGATGVGASTTSSVVNAIFAIIVLDLVWGLVFYLR